MLTHKIPDSPDVRAILSSGRNEHVVVQRLSGSGLADFVHKPYNIAHLNETLARVLRTVREEEPSIS